VNELCDCKLKRITNIHGYYDPEIVYCSVHAHAFETLAALKAIGTLPDGYCFCPAELVKNNIKTGNVIHTGECLQAQAAIKAAEGDK
jgi:hypothetical protein